MRIKKIGANKNKDLQQNSKLFINITNFLKKDYYVIMYVTIFLQIKGFILLHFSNTQTNNEGEWSKERKKIPNENPAGNLYTEFYCLQREKGGSSKMLILVQLCDSSLYPPQHLVYCFAYVHNQYLNEWMEAYEAQSSEMLYFNFPPLI